MPWLNPTYREVDGRMIRGTFLQAIVHTVHYHVTTIRVYEDGMIFCWDDLVDLDGFRQKVRQGQVVTSVPNGATIFLGTEVGVYLTATDVYAGGDTDDLIGQVEDELRELRGELTSSDLCRAAYDAYQADPSDATKEQLRAAYFAVPKHQRPYLLFDMNGRDAAIREVLDYWD
jgi:hypothetical protein